MIDALVFAFSFLPKVVLSVGGVNVSGVLNQTRHKDDKTHGGYEPNDEAVFAVLTSDLTNPKALLGEVVGGEWRVAEVRTGEAITHLHLVSHDKA